MVWEVLCCLNRMVIRHRQWLDILLPEVDELLWISYGRWLSMKNMNHVTDHLKQSLTADLNILSMADISTWVLQESLSLLLYSALSLPSPRGSSKSFMHLAKVWPDMDEDQRILCFILAVKHRNSFHNKSLDSFHLEGLISLAATFDPSGPHFLPMLKCLNCAIKHWFMQSRHELANHNVFKLRDRILAVDELMRHDVAFEGCLPLGFVVMVEIAHEFSLWAKENDIEHLVSFPSVSSGFGVALEYFWGKFHAVLISLVSKTDCTAMDAIFLFRAVASISKHAELPQDHSKLSNDINSVGLALLESVTESHPAPFRFRMSLLMATCAVDRLEEAGIDCHYGKYLDSLILAFKENKRMISTQSQSEGSEEVGKSSARLSVLLSTFSKLMRFVTFMDPEKSIFILGELTVFWSALDISNPLMYTCYEELQSITKSCPENILSALQLHSNTALQQVFLPVLRNCETKGIDIFWKLLTLLQIDKQTFAKIFGNQLLSIVLISKELSLTATIRRIRDQMDDEIKSIFDITTSFEENALFLCDAVNCSECADRSMEELICGEYLSFLQETADAFGLAVCTEIKSSTIQKILSHLLPDLCTSRKNDAMRALGVLSSLFSLKSMTASRAYDQRNIKSTTADVIAGNFLFIMSSVIQRDWREKSISTQVNYIHGLESIINLLRQSDASKFIHKLLFFIDTAITSRSSDVLLAVSSLMDLLLESLPKNALNENLPTIMVTLYRLIEIHEQRTEFIHDFPNSTSLWRMLLYYVPRSKNIMVSSMLSFIFEAATDSHWQTASCRMTRATAIQAIRNLYSSRIHEIQNSWTKVPYIPDEPELHALHDAHEHQLRGQTTVQRIQSLSHSLLHESPHVRLASLRRIRQFISENKNEIYTNLALKESSIGSSCSTDLVSQLLGSLLRLCSMENDNEIRNVCGICLGEIGAIDPARVSIDLGTTTSEEPPWSRKVTDFGFCCIRDHLVPSLKSVAGGSLASLQDRIGFAIQEILHRIAELTDGCSGDSTSFPEELRSSLVSYRILDVCEPFWQSRYFMKRESELEELEYWAEDNDFDRWISRWCRHFMKSLKGPFTSLLQACRGAIRSRPSLGQYLLPHLIVNTLQYGEYLQQRNEITDEILRILRSRADDSGAQAVQAIFLLIDALENWVSATQHILSDDIPQDEVEKAQTFCERVSALLAGIPKATLSDAALSIKSFARAIRYFEQETRENNPRVERIDGSNYTLPLLSENNLEKLGCIYSQLGCGDGVRGVRQLRGISAISCSPMNTINEFEADGRWFEALQEYDFLKSSTVWGALNVNTSVLEKGYIERRRLRCYMELGQLEAVTPQMEAIVNGSSDEKAMRDALLPLSIEASWQLGKWDDLDSHLKIIEQSKNISADNYGIFQIRLGRLFSSMSRRDRNSFTHEIQDTRNEVVMAMSAACMESYQRAYPYLTKLHGDFCMYLD